MGFEIETIDGSYRVKYEPSWVTGLQSGDDITAVGNIDCLVVAFSVWSTPDRETAYRGIEVAKSSEAFIPICLLPYDYPEEMETWLSSEVEKPGVVVGEAKTDDGAVKVGILQDERTSPIWFTVHEGEIADMRQGPLQDDEIVCLLSAVTP